jgi:hypothetical protein
MENDYKRLSSSLQSLFDQKILKSGMFLSEKFEVQRFFKENHSCNRIPVIYSVNMDVSDSAQTDAFRLLQTSRVLSFSSPIYLLGIEYVVVSQCEKGVYARSTCGDGVGIFVMKSKSEKYVCVGWHEPDCLPSKAAGAMMIVCRNL